MADAKKAEKAAKKQARAQKRAQRRANYSQIWQAFKIQRKQDKALVPIMLSAFLGMGLVFFLLGKLWGGQWFMLIIGLLLGFTLAMFLFSRRVQNTVYDKAANEPGAAGWALDNLKSNFAVTWRTKNAVATNAHMDMVHRVTGVCGYVLVGEGDPQRLNSMMNKVETRLNKLAPGVPVHRIIVGEGEGQVPLRKLQTTLMKLPRVYKKDEVYQIANRVEAMDHLSSQNTGLPKGPIPKGAKVSGMNRRVRRSQERKQG